MGGVKKTLFVGFTVMAKFQYSAINLSGESSSATVDAASEKEALESLTQQGLSVVELRLVEGGKTSTSAAPNPTDTEQEDDDDSQGEQESRVTAPLDSILFFYEQVGFLLGAGIPLYLCVKMVIENINESRFVEVLESIMFELSEGNLFSKALRKYPKCFPNLHTKLIAVGESTGQMDKVLSYVVELAKEQTEIREKFKNALSYPIFIVCLSSLLVSVMVLVVFPQFESIFKSFNVKLPQTTQFFMDTGSYVRSHVTESIMTVGGVLGGLFYFFKSERMADVREELYLRIPIVSDIYMSMFVALFSKNLSSLVKSGIPILDALKICRDTLAPEGSLRFEFMDEVIDLTKEGESISDAIERTDFVPEMVWQLTSVGEQTGELGSMLDNIFKFYKKKYLDSLDKLSAILKPLLMFGAAGIIALVAASLFLPLFGLGRGLRSGG